MKLSCKVVYRWSSILFLCASVVVNAAGYQVQEQSATGLGRSNAGDAAIADTALVLTKNAAAMTQFDSLSISSHLTFIAPSIDSDYQTEECSGGVFNPVCGTVDKSENDYAPDQFVPSFAVIAPINDRWFAGIAMFSNFGTGTELSDDFSYGDIGGETSIITIDTSFNLAYKLNDHISIGGGYDLVFAEAEMKRNTGNPLTGKFDMKGDTFGHGWNIGSLISINEDHRFALTYRSRVEIALEGDYTGTGLLSPKGGGTAKGEVAVNLPAIAEFSGFHQLNDTFALHYSAMWTNWSEFDHIEATSDDCGIMFDEGVCFYKPLTYKDSIRYAVGATVFATDATTLRFGYSFDNQAGDSVVVMPDTNRHQLSTGMSYQWNNSLSFDIGIAYLMGEEARYEEHSDLPGDNPHFVSTASAWIASGQMNYSF